jgi:hypothetical protein
MELKNVLIKKRQVLSARDALSRAFRLVIEIGSLKLIPSVEDEELFDTFINGEE